MHKLISFISLMIIMFLTSSMAFALDTPVPLRAPYPVVPITTSTYTVGNSDNLNVGRYYESYGSLFIAQYAGTTTITLPNYAATQSGATVTLGAVVCVYSSLAQSVVIDPSADDKIRLDDTLGSAGATITSAGEIGNFVCLTLQESSSDIGIWASWGISGVWTAP
jgi:hypothetical protein